MCLFKIRQEEDVAVPVRRVVRARSPSPTRVRRTSQQRYSREVIRESRPHSSSYIVQTPQPQGLRVPEPQPVPVFVEPPPAPIAVPAPPPPPSHVSSHHHGGAHYVEVSPRSSLTSHSPDRSDYIMHEREYRRERRRDYSPAPPSPRYETYRYVEGTPEEDDRYARYSRRERSRSRARSISRDYDYDPRGSYRETNTRITIGDSDGRRTREYRR